MFWHHACSFLGIMSALCVHQWSLFIEFFDNLGAENIVPVGFDALTDYRLTYFHYVDKSGSVFQRQVILKIDDYIGDVRSDILDLKTKRAGYFEASIIPLCESVHFTVESSTWLFTKIVSLRSWKQLKSNSRSWWQLRADKQKWKAFITAFKWNVPCPQLYCNRVGRYARHEQS